MPLFGPDLLRRIILRPDERIENQVICPVCEGILVEPKACSACEMHYCGTCLPLIFLENKGHCSCKEKLIPQEPHKVFKKILHSYCFRCSNFSNGCTERIVYENVFLHEASCDFKRIPCENELCDSVIPKHEYPFHLQSCGYKKKDCVYCGQLFLSCDIDAHQQICDRLPTKCPGCEMQVYQIDFARHLQNCDAILQTCEVCKCRFTRRQFQTHAKLDCMTEVFKQNKKEVEDKIAMLTGVVAELTRKVEEQERMFNFRCGDCGKFACEVSQYSCAGCKGKVCALCFRKNLKNCVVCKEFVCKKCMTMQNVCFGCQKKKKGQKLTSS